MMQVLYDGSFQGLLTCIFEIYERKLPLITIQKQNSYQPDAFASPLMIISDSIKSHRVWKGLESKTSKMSLHQIYQSFLSEITGIENVIYDYIRYAFASPIPIEKDFGNSSVLTISQTAHKVHREKHRMEAFVRFQLTKDNLYYALIEPDFNVLPLIASHFKNRYADQQWLIYDVRRKYGIYHDMLNETVREVEIGEHEPTGIGILPICIFHDDEHLYQTLWKDYFKSVNIKSRRNVKLHLRHVPTRYWKFLTEKT